MLKKAFEIVKSMGRGLLFFVITFIAIFLMMFALPWAWIGWAILDSNLGDRKFFKGLAMLLIMPMTLIVMAVMWRRD